MGVGEGTWVGIRGNAVVPWSSPCSRARGERKGEEEKPEWLIPERKCSSHRQACHREVRARIVRARCTERWGQKLMSCSSSLRWGVWGVRGSRVPRPGKRRGACALALGGIRWGKAEPQWQKRAVRPPRGTHRGTGAGGGAGGRRPLDRDQSHLGAAGLFRAGHSCPECGGREGDGAGMGKGVWE